MTGTLWETQSAYSELRSGKYLEQVESQRILSSEVDVCLIHL